MPGLRHRYALVRASSADRLVTRRMCCCRNGSAVHVMGGMFRASVLLSEQFGLPLACYLCNSWASRGSPDGDG